MNYETLKLERLDKYIGILSLNRPDSLNALSVEMIDELRDFFSQLRGDLQTRVVVVRGEGRAFCAGLDLNAMAAGLHVHADDDLGDVQYVYHKVQQTLSNIPLAMRSTPQPLIAAVRGPAAGGGFALALACDVRIAGESARFNTAFIRIGASACDMGTSYFLPRLIGLSRAAEYMFTGRFIDAAAADRFGLVSRVVPDNEVDAAALALAEEMLRNSPFGLRMTKEVLSMNTDAPCLESAIRLEDRTQVLCGFTEDCQEGPRAFLEKRPPMWHDR